MRFMGRHGYYEHELEHPQPFEVDVELVLNLQPAGIDDDLTRTIDYGRVYDIVRQIVDIHGGRAWVESTLGAGSDFQFTLPLPQPTDGV